jgi:two-component system, NarL family, response regulator LiaR
MTKVLIVDDHAVVRQGLYLYLSADPKISVVGEAENGLEAISQVECLKPDVVVMDLLMPVMDGIAATREIRAKFEGVEVLALTSSLEEHKINGAIQAGAIGYLLKDAKADDIREAIHAAARGEVRLSAAAKEKLLREYRAPDMREHLTARETLTLQLLARGQSNLEMATELGVNESTVKTHVSRLLSKLELTSRTQAALFALKHGIASLEKEV